MSRPRTRDRAGAWAGVDLSSSELSKLYEVYSSLHRLGQQTRSPIDVPIITVVGHQTDGKSALIEALMGFQFNHVGGGTKTRRPVAIEMVHDAGAEVPQCFLATDDGYEEKTLADLKEHIEKQNAGLAAEGRFEAADIIVKIRYKHCPNLMIIDTPGLMSPASDSDQNQRTQAAQVLEIVRQKISQDRSINLCLEDNSDWVNATTRRVVLQVDPQMQRTVLVSTKFDTRLAQFATSADASAFLHPPPEQLAGSSMLGGSPFFTSVPSGRVGSDEKDIFKSDEEFQAKVKEQEEGDRSRLEEKLRRPLTPEERCHIGVSSLRNFLESELLRRYQEHLPSIARYFNETVYSLEHEVKAVKDALETLNDGKVKEHVRRVLLAVMKQVAQLLSGDACIPDYANAGQSLEQERQAVDDGGRLQCQPGFELKEGWEEHVQSMFGNRQLYGGAQYSRALDEFRVFVRHIMCPEISSAETDNKCGMGPRTDAPNITSVAAQLAADKAKRAFEPLLPQLGQRVKHVLHLLMQHSLDFVAESGGESALQSLDGRILDCIQGHYTQFLQDHVREAEDSALEDLNSRTHFVTLEHSDAKFTVQFDVESNDVTAIVQAHSEEAPEVLKRLVQKRIGPLFSQPRRELVQKSVPELTHGFFGSIREGFVGDTVRKFNYKLMLQLQDGLTEYLQRCMDGEDVGALCSTDEIKRDLEERQKSLDSELKSMEQLKSQFADIKSLLRKGTALAARAP